MITASKTNSHEINSEYGVVVWYKPLNLRATVDVDVLSFSRDLPTHFSQLDNEQNDTDKI